MIEHSRKDRETVFDKFSRNVEVPGNVHCRCVIPKPSTKEVAVYIEFALAASDTLYTPARILKNGEATVVFWKDGTKTVVKPANGIIPNDYEAFTAALAKKIFGNNSALKKVIQRNTVIQEPKRKKGDPQ